MLLKKIEEQSVQIAVCSTLGMEQQHPSLFHVGNGATAPQAVLQEGLKPPHA